MKKKVLVAGMAMALSMAMLTGCGNAKEDYESDLKELTSYSTSDELDTSDTDKMIEQMNDMVDELDMKTDEGKDVKENLQSMVDATKEVFDSLEDADEDAMTEASEKLETITEKAKSSLSKFKDAATDAGVDEDELKNLNLD